VARLTPERLDVLGLPMLAISHQSMDSSVSVAKVAALLVWTGETLGIDAFGGTSPAFDLAPGAYWNRYWSCTQRGSGGMLTDGAIVGGARLEQTVELAAHLGGCSRPGRTLMGPPQGTQQRESEDEEEHEQEHMEVHEESSWLENEQKGEFPFRKKNKEP
jgi:hypothetical protein